MATDCGPILIVDDHESFRAFASVLFVRAGFSVLQAATGEEGLAAVRERRPALVLLDVSLPDISGFEVCRALREEFGEELPIIFVSGERIEAIDRAVGLLLGGDDYVVKPFDPDELLARVRRPIARSSGTRAVVRMSSDDVVLTPREFQVLEKLVEGRTSADIADELVISSKTVRSHVQRILAKLGVHSRAQAIAIAYQRGLIRDSTDKEASSVA